MNLLQYVYTHFNPPLEHRAVIDAGIGELFERFTNYSRG